MEWGLWRKNDLKRGMCSKLALLSLFCTVKNSMHQLCMGNIIAVISFFKFIPL